MNKKIRKGDVAQLAGFCRPSRAVVFVERTTQDSAFVRFLDGSGRGTYSPYAMRKLPVVLA